jgi:hypothetical protein
MAYICPELTFTMRYIINFLRKVFGRSMPQGEIENYATALANATDTDIFLFNGYIGRPCDRKLIEMVNAWPRRKNIALFISTPGGDPSAAYRIARILQNKYEKFTVYILGICKSSGTLLALGANELVMNENGELGPLDIQLAKKDELSDTDSGLTVLSAIDELQAKAFEIFENGFLSLKVKSGGRITLKTATAIAREMALGLIAPVIAHVDPLHVGEVSRAMKIGKEYGERLNQHSKNMDDSKILTLTNSYPTHGFVIDEHEAKTLFKSVRSPNDAEKDLIESLGNLVKFPQREQNQAPYSLYLSEKKQVPPDAPATEEATNGNEPDNASNAE